jgi:multiple sugar transport system permease protein
MPNILTTASVAMLFRSLFGYGSPPTAPVNIVLQSWGLFQTYIQDGQVVRGAFDFFRSVAFSRGLVSFIQWWLFYGVTVILWMAGITSIPVTLYESALVDGANSRQTAWRITLPLLRPMMLYLLVTSMIGGMQILDIPMLLTDGRGSPNLSIRTTTLFLYNVGFSGANDYAYAASISVGMFIITVFLALIIFFFLQDRSELKKERKGV